jgi:hypothetical protein
MIIQIETPDAARLDKARRDLQDLARSWDQEITDTPAGTPATRTDGKIIDPVAIASLAVSLPSAALAVADLADRIRKRRRATDLINHARQLAASQVTITVITSGRAAQVSTLTPDQLLDLEADQNPAS